MEKQLSKNYSKSFREAKEKNDISGMSNLWDELCRELQIPDEQNFDSITSAQEKATKFAESRNAEEGISKKGLDKITQHQ